MRLRLTPNGKRQAAVCSKVSRTHFSLFRVCSIAVADSVEISLNQKSFIVFHQRENFSLAFALKAMLNLSIVLRRCRCRRRRRCLSSLLSTVFVIDLPHLVSESTANSTVFGS